MQEAPPMNVTLKHIQVPGQQLSAGPPKIESLVSQRIALSSLWANYDITINITIADLAHFFEINGSLHRSSFYWGLYAGNVSQVGTAETATVSWISLPHTCYKVPARVGCWG